MWIYKYKFLIWTLSNSWAYALKHIKWWSYFSQWIRILQIFLYGSTLFSRSWHRIEHINRYQSSKRHTLLEFFEKHHLIGCFICKFCNKWFCYNNICLCIFHLQCDIWISIISRFFLWRIRTNKKFGKNLSVSWQGSNFIVGRYDFWFRYLL